MTKPRVYYNHNLRSWIASFEHLSALNDRFSVRDHLALSWQDALRLALFASTRQPVTIDAMRLFNKTRTAP